MFSSDLADKNVVIEYVSDGLQNELWEQSITVHKYLRKALEDHIYYECIARKRMCLLMKNIGLIKNTNHHDTEPF
jgi:hypothetical protein